MGETVFTKALKRWMEENDYTQTAAATILEVEQPTLSKWLRGGTPREDKWPALARALRVDQVQLVQMLTQAHASRVMAEAAASGGPDLAVLVDEIRELRLSFDRLAEAVTDKLGFGGSIDLRPPEAPAAGKRHRRPKV